jgi:hypothetical protein
MGVYTKVQLGQMNLPSVACYFLAPQTSPHLRKLHAPFGSQTIKPTSAAAHASLMISNRPSAQIWPVLGAKTSPYTFGVQGYGGSQLAAGRWPATCVQRPQLQYAIHALTGATASRQPLDRGKQSSRELHLGQRAKNNVASGVRTAAALVAGNYSFPHLHFLFHYHCARVASLSLTAIVNLNRSCGIIGPLFYHWIHRHWPGFEAFLPSHSRFYHHTFITPSRTYIA